MKLLPSTWATLKIILVLYLGNAGLSHGAQLSLHGASNDGLAESVHGLPDAAGPPHLSFDYHNYDAMTGYLRAVNARYPNLTALYSIGKSVNGPCPVVHGNFNFQLQSHSLSSCNYDQSPWLVLFKVSNQSQVCMYPTSETISA